MSEERFVRFALARVEHAPARSMVRARVGGNAHVGEAAPASGVLDVVVGSCNGRSSLSCAEQQGLVVALTAIGGLAAGLLSGSVLGGLLGAVVGNFAGRKINGGAPTTGATCLALDARNALVKRILSNEVSQSDAEKMAQSYEISGCTEDAAAIRIAAKTAASGDLVPHKVQSLSSGILDAASKATTIDTSKAIYDYVLTDADVALTPLGFAIAAGYKPPASCDLQSYAPCTAVDALLADNPTMTKSVASPMAGHPEIYAVLGRAPHSDIDSVLGYFAISPWSAGTSIRRRGIFP